MSYFIKYYLPTLLHNMKGMVITKIDKNFFAKCMNGRFDYNKFSMM